MFIVADVGLNMVYKTYTNTIVDFTTYFFPDYKKLWLQLMWFKQKNLEFAKPRTPTFKRSIKILLIIVGANIMENLMISIIG